MITHDAQQPQDQPAEQPYSSFLIRCWGLSDGKRRIKVQHIQSGEWKHVPTLAAASEWMDGHCPDQRMHSQRELATEIPTG